MILTNLLRRDANAGVVVATTDDTLTIATTTGTLTAKRNDATAYQIADSVKLANGQAVGRLRKAGQVIRV